MYTEQHGYLAPTAGAGERLLREHGLRVTRPRLAVLAVLAEGGHLEVDEVAERPVTNKWRSGNRCWGGPGGAPGGW